MVKFLILLTACLILGCKPRTNETSVQAIEESMTLPDGKSYLASVIDLAGETVIYKDRKCPAPDSPDNPCDARWTENRLPMAQFECRMRTHGAQHLRNPDSLDDIVSRIIANLRSGRRIKVTADLKHGPYKPLSVIEQPHTYKYQEGDTVYPVSDEEQDLFRAISSTYWAAFRLNGHVPRPTCKEDAKQPCCTSTGSADQAPTGSADHAFPSGN